MKIVHDFSEECFDGVNTYLDLEEFGDNSEEIVLFYGIACTNNKELQEQYKHYKKRIILDLWSPCQLYSNDRIGQNYFEQCSYFTDVFCICPCTVEWANRQTNSDKWKFIFYPWQPKLKPVNFDKKYDVCFVGGIHSQEHKDAIDLISSKFNYRFISQMDLPQVTDFNVSTQEKLNIIAQSKITLCFNLLYLTENQCHFALNNYDLQTNEAFGDLRKIGHGNFSRYTIPQFKSRMHEAAIGQSLILCKNDPWNISGAFYAPTELIYYNENFLELTINDILKQYDNLSLMIKNAEIRAETYTTKKLIEYITKKVEV